MRYAKTVFCNAKFIAQNDALVHAVEPGYMSGFGLFETMRSLREKIVYLDAHLERIRQSCLRLGIELPYRPDALKKIIYKVVRQNGIEDAYVRLTLWKKEKGSDILIVAKKYDPLPAQKYLCGFSACIGAIGQEGGPVLGGLKTINRIVYELNFQAAKDNGFDEALMLDRRGYISEGTRSNVFFVKDRELFTPGLECGCLEGITRKVIFDLARKFKIKVYEGKFTAENLCAADEAFLTNSLMGVIALSSLEKNTIGRPRCGEITRFFMTKYSYLLK